jgi:hypothetical protein
MSIYDNAAATSLRLLSKFGQNVVLRKFGAGVYTNGVMTPSTADSTLKGAVFDYLRMKFGEVLQNGTLVQGADRNLYLAANGARPELDDHIFLANGSEWNIVEIKATEPGGTPVLYACRIRQ